MKKNTLYIVLIMLLACVNTAWGTVREVNSENALKSAINLYQSGDVIKLTSNIEITEEFNISKAITINGQNCSLIRSGKNEYNYENNNKAGLYFNGISEGTVEIENLKIAGFAYAINATYDVANVTFNITNCELYGRAGINNWGDNNTFNVKNSKIAGVNNENAASNQDFACIVDNYEAQVSKYYLDNVTVEARSANGKARQAFVSLYGEGGIVKLVGNTTFSRELAENSPFINDPTQLTTTNVYFDQYTKLAFEDLIEACGREISDEPVASGTYSGLYPLAPLANSVDLDGTLYDTIEEAFGSTDFGPNSIITLKTNISLNENITANITDSGDGFTLNTYDAGADVHYSLNPNGHKISLKYGVKVEYDGTNGPELFAAANPSTTILNDGTTYLAGNIYENENDGYGLLEEALALEGLSSGSVITLQNNITLADDIECGLDGTLNESYTLTCGNYKLTSANGKIKLADGAKIISDKSLADVLAAATTGHDIIITKEGSKYVHTAGEITDPVAEIGSAKFATLEDAIAAVADGQTIKLLKNVVTATPITISKGGFTIDGGDGNAIICNDATVTDPVKQYLNNTGALSFNGSGAVTIENLDIKGFAYAINVVGTGIGVTMNGGKTYGRAALNVHGNNNSFTFSGVEVHGMNNENASGNEAFAAFVLDSNANNNELNIENCPVIATIAHDNGYNTEKFIELRGANNKVFISGSNSSYSCNPAEIGGFTNNTEDLSNDKVFFDESAKTKLNPLFASISDLQISDIESADYEGYYPLTNTVAVVVLTNAVNYPTEKFMFSTIEQAFQSDKFDFTQGTEIKLLGNITLAEDITPTMGNGDMFTIDLNGKTLNGGGHHINLAPGAVVEVVGGATDDTKALFAATDPTTTIVASDAEVGSFVYTAANCIIKDVPTLFYETVVDTTDEDEDGEPDGELTDGSILDLATDIAMTADLDLSAFIGDGDSFKLNFGDYNFTGGWNMLLADGASVTTDKQTDLFKPATAGSYIMETPNANGYTYTVYATAPADGVVLNETTNMLYTTLQAATAAANENDVIKLLANITTDKKVDVTKPMTIYGENVTLQTTAADGKYINLLPAFNFTGITTPTAVEIKGINIKGFAYAANIDEPNVKNLTLTMNGQGNQKISGRAVINNWGSNNTFNVEGYAIEGLNNQPAPQSNYDYEYFATFVDYEGAKANTYNIKDCEVEATVATTASNAATEKFIDLRGTDAKVKIYNTSYEYTEGKAGRGGFTNDDYVNLLVSSNKVWFDQHSKVNFAALIDVYPTIAIADNADETGLWPLVNINGVVRLTPDPINAKDVYYHFSSLEEAIASSYFKPSAQIDLLGDVTVTEDITLPTSFVAKDIDMIKDRFTLNLIDDDEVKHTITVAEGKGITLNPLIYVSVLGGADGAVDGLFKVSNENTVICSEVDGTEKTYTAANVKFYSADLDFEMYYMFNDLFTDDDILSPTDDVITLMTNVAIANDRDMLLASGKKMTINFGVDNDNDYDITGANLLLADGASIITNRQTDIIEAKTNGHFVLETANGDETYTYTVSATAPSVDDDYVARIDNRYFTTLQDATNVAQDGETVVLLKDITTEQPVNITTAITLDGDGYEVTSNNVDPAFKVSGNGDVTINKLKVKATEGDAIEVINDYAGKLTLNNDTITTSRRGIDVQSIADGFALTVNSSLIQSTVGDPTAEYVNSNNDPDSPGRGINFGNDAVTATVNIDKSLIQGFAYGVNVSQYSGKLNVTLSDGTFYGRAIVNNWGDGSTFNIDNMTVNGLNNEPTPGSELDYEKFATIVDNADTNPNDNNDWGQADYNNYNINNSTFTANADNADANAATEMFIDLRGNSARVKITGNTTYTYKGTTTDRGGLTNVDYFKNLVDNNKVWFDETAKSVFKPLVESFNGDAFGNVTILDELDPVVNLYPIGTFQAGVVMQVTDDNNVTTNYYFKDLASALASPLFGADVTIELLENQTLDKDFTVTVPFTLNLVEEIDDTNTETHTITGNGKFKVEPANSVTVLGGSAATDGLFKVAEGYEEYAAIIKDGDTDPTYYAGNVYIDYGTIFGYDYFDFLFDKTLDEELQPNGYIRLETDFKLDKSLNCPIGGDETPIEKFYINFDGKTITPNGNAIVLKPGTEVYVNGNAENLFSSADPEYTVWYEEASETLMDEEKDEEVTFTKKYYLMKDGLAVTVAPATYCGHEQVPTIEVKKRVESKTTPGTYEWKTLEAGTDYTWSLVPKENEDDYIAAKTYANSVVIEGKTFQGRRKADFIINPRNINDATVKGNEQPWRANGYTAGLIAGHISAEYGCIISDHYVDGGSMVYMLKKKGSTTADEKPDYVVTVNLAENQRIYDIGTYNDLITLTALEGVEGTQNFVGSRKVDFVILPGEGIDIANVLVTSKAVYNSYEQTPSYNTIEVVYKNGYDRVVLDPEQFTIDYHGLMHDYIDAKTYFNAMTLKGTMKPGTTNNLRFYGTINADYVIMPRDLADTDFEDDKVQVVLEKNKDMDWTGEDLTNEIKIGDIAGANNIYFYMKVQTGDTYNGYRYVLTNDATTGKYDYSYTVEPSPMKDPGEYKVIFTGRGNFTGMREVKIAVLKDISAAKAEIAMQVIPGVNETNYTEGQGLKPSEMEGIVVTDGTETLTNGEHYTVIVKGQSGTDYTETNPIKNNGVYIAHITGEYPYYKGEQTKEFPAVFEYYTRAATTITPSENKFGIHVTSGVDKTANVGALNDIAVDPNKQGLIIDPTKTIQLGASSPFTFVELTIAGIDDNAFNGGNALRYVDASKLDGYEPSSLSRNADGPFNGISKQAIVYLDGDDVIGENYVYKTSAGDFRCDEFKIYDDFDGNQKGFDGEGQGSHSWEIINIHEFTAKTLTNTRYFNAGQHYTTLLPYDLPLPETLKAYNLTAASDGIFGFREIEEDALTSFMPYVLIPSAAGNLLSTTDAVVKVTATANRGFYPLRDNQHRQKEAIAKSGYVLYGSMIYMGHTSTTPIIEGTYIMQSGNQWKKIAPNSTYDGACILPMRAYILKLNDGIDGHSREFMSAKFIDAAEKMATDMAGDDWSDAEVYDLQGRKVDTTQQMRKGVYIVNGQKRIRK